MAAYKIVDKETGDIIGRFVTNHSVTFDQAMELAGFEWTTIDKSGGDSDGWSKDKGRTIWDQSVAEIEIDE